MIPAQFDYLTPKTLDEAVGLLAQHPDEAKVLAGGHSLIPAMKLRLATPQILIDIEGSTDYAVARIPNELIIRLAHAGQVPDLAAPIFVRREQQRPERRSKVAQAFQPPISHSQQARIDSERLRPVAIDAPAPNLLGRARVVIDAGHGGFDPGTISSSVRSAPHDTTSASALFDAA